MCKQGQGQRRGRGRGRVWVDTHLYARRSLSLASLLSFLAVPPSLPLSARARPRADTTTVTRSTRWSGCSSPPSAPRRTPARRCPCRCARRGPGGTCSASTSASASTQRPSRPQRDTTLGKARARARMQGRAGQRMRMRMEGSAGLGWQTGRRF